MLFVSFVFFSVYSLFFLSWSLASFFFAVSLVWCLVCLKTFMFALSHFNTVYCDRGVRGRQVHAQNGGNARAHKACINKHVTDNIVPRSPSKSCGHFANRKWSITLALQVSGWRDVVANSWLCCHCRNLARGSCLAGPLIQISVFRQLSGGGGGGYRQSMAFKRYVWTLCGMEFLLSRSFEMSLYWWGKRRNVCI